MDDYQHFQTDAQVIIRPLTCALNLRDKYTHLHSTRVAGLAVDIGKRCCLSYSELKLLHVGATLHDIGKIGIADNVLFKPGRFNREEWQEMKTHAEKGQYIIKSLAFKCKNQVADIVRHHHENFDGSGYPDSLKGEEIPVLSRIISIVDSYDAIAERRCYHRSRSHNEVIDILMSEASFKYDPYILNHFMRKIEYESANTRLAN